jgi:hypothetical protein
MGTASRKEESESLPWHQPAFSWKGLCLTAKECDDQSEQLIALVLGGRDFSTAIP